MEFCCTCSWWYTHRNKVPSPLSWWAQWAKIIMHVALLISQEFSNVFSNTSSLVLPQVGGHSKSLPFFTKKYYGENIYWKCSWYIMSAIETHKHNTAQWITGVKIFSFGVCACVLPWRLISSTVASRNRDENTRRWVTQTLRCLTRLPSTPSQVHKISHFWALASSVKQKLTPSLYYNLHSHFI